MKWLVGLTVMIMIGTSQANTSPTTTANVTKNTSIDTLAQIATKKELAHVRSIRVSKPKLFRSNPFRKSFFINVTLEDDDDIFIQDEDLATAYRRKDIDHIKKLKPNDDLPEHIRWRLFLARQLALLKYKEKWANA